MSRKLYLHVGPRKTGTTAVQQALTGRGDSTINFPMTGRGGPANYRGHHGLVFAHFERLKRDGGRADASKLFNALREEVEADDRDILITSEMLESENVRAFADALLSHLRLALEVEILFTCREHFSRAASLYNHRLRLKNSPERRSPDEFLADDGRKIRYAPLVRKLRKAGHRVTALNYHPSQDWVKRFLTHIGVPEQDVPENKSVLIAYSPRMLIATLAVKRTVQSPDRQFELIRQLSREISQSREPSRFIFGRDAALQAERFYSADRQFLKDEFGIDLVPPDLSARTCEFLISGEDLGEIAAAAAKYGSEGESLVDFARQYVA